MCVGNLCYDVKIIPVKVLMENSMAKSPFFEAYYQRVVEEYDTIRNLVKVDSSKEEQELRAVVLDVHAEIEGLMDLLIATYFLKEDKAQLFSDLILIKMDFSKKLALIKDAKLLPKPICNKVYKINNYRVAQAHFKRSNPLREASEENSKGFLDALQDVPKAFYDAILANNGSRERLSEFFNKVSKKNLYPPN
jgi:hypothetical protein